MQRTPLGWHRRACGQLQAHAESAHAISVPCRTCHVRHAMPVDSCLQAILYAATADEGTALRRAAQVRASVLHCLRLWHHCCYAACHTEGGWLLGTKC